MGHEHKDCCHGHNHGDNCECGHSHESEEMSTEYLVENNNILLNTLIDLLIEKGLISESELRTKLDEVSAEVEEETEDSESGEDEEADVEYEDSEEEDTEESE